VRFCYCNLAYPLEVEKLQPQPLAEVLDSIVVLNGITAVTGRNLIIEDTGAKERRQSGAGAQPAGARLNMVNSEPTAFGAIIFIRDVTVSGGDQGLAAVPASAVGFVPN
jgi:hypothetical protein